MNLFNVICLIALYLIMVSCDKNNQATGRILITVSYKNQIVYPAEVYLKFGPAQDSVLIPSVFDDRQAVGPYGEASFDNLKTGQYILFAEGFERYTERRIHDYAFVDMGSRSRQNDVSIIMELK